MTHKGKTYNEQPKTAVVVNDDRTQLTLLTGLLENAGIQVQGFGNAEAALLAMDRAAPPDLVVTDLYMPGLDGWRFCRLLRSPEYAAFNPVPILVVSATFAGDEVSRITADLNADAFLPLPADPKRFTETALSLIAGGQPKDQQRVLIVSDNESLVGILKEAFAAEGYRTDAVFTLQEAGERFMVRIYDLAMINSGLPDGPGDTLIGDFRSIRPDCICIMITDDPDPQLALKWMKQGAAAYLRMPFDPAYLLEVYARARRERALLRVEDLLEERTLQLRASEEKYRALVEGSLQGVVVAREDPLRILFASPAMAQLTGHSPEALQNMNPDQLNELVHPEDRIRFFRNYVSRLNETQVPQTDEFRLIHEDGSLVWVLLHAAHIQYQDEPATLISFVDITRRKQIEEILEKKSQEQRLLLDTIDTQVWYLTDVETYGRLNRTHADFLGLDVREVAHKRLEEFVPKEVAEVCKASNVEVFETKKPVHTEEWVPNADGEERLIAVTKTPKLNEKGEVEYEVCAGTDITELRTSEQWFRSIFELAPIGIEIYDASGRLLSANQTALNIFGIFDTTEIQGFQLFEDPNVGRKQKERLLDGEIVQYEVEFDFEKVRDAGLYQTSKRGKTSLYVLITPMMTDEEPSPCGFLVLIQDITERRRLEQRLHQIEKAESLSRMAGAVAHHFNNMLGAVTGNLELARMEMTEGKDITHMLAEAEHATLRAADMSQLMLTLLGQTPSRPKPMDLSQTCEARLTALNTEVPDGITLKTDIHLPGPVVKADPAQLGEVLQSLLTNAWEAMGDTRGSLRVSVSTLKAEDITDVHRFPVDWQASTEGYACLMVADDGCGMEAQTIARIFDPFYTDKFTGRGLGLAVSLGIVKAAGGCITVESEPGQGSTFQVFLPLSSEALPVPDVKEKGKMAKGGVILLAEDEKMVRDAAVAILEYLGFEVLAAGDGVEAVGIFRNRQEDIRLVITDLTMPRMDGWEVLTAVRRIRPDIPVILASGYEAAQAMKGHHDQQPQAFLPKPFQMKGLEAALARALTKQP
ncbi:MAG: response regulator [Deltaproteobacteria bacterium]|nr:response regulator [Deltaproteobacteria bacterium]MCF8118738.1 response regulator [Deltaproteobacteria bacterium]